MGKAARCGDRQRAGEVGVRQVIGVIVDDDADASLALHRNRGFVDAGRLSSVGFKHGRWLDTLLLQRTSIQPVGDVGESRVVVAVI